MDISYPTKTDFYATLKEAQSESVDFVVIVTAVLPPNSTKEILQESVRVLRNGGLLFVQGLPEHLPEWGVYLDRQLNFKYWIAIESQERETDGLPSVHGAVMLFSKGNGRFHIKRTRFPHQYCRACGKTLKDWGGKTHLMHPDGYVISDVWQDLPQADNYSQISGPVMETILRMLDFKPRRSQNSTLLQQKELQKLDRGIKGIVGPKEGIAGEEIVGETAVQYHLPGILKPDNNHSQATNQLGDQLIDYIHVGDALELLKQYPTSSVDLVFADPPYNLDKAYHTYDDDRADQEYVNWCNRWLKEYIRILKPTGSLFVLNLPRWTMHHAAFLNQHLTFQNWIVWNALSEPRGKLMPAHYGLLFYTKKPQGFTFNYKAVKELDARYYCLRASCVRQRKAKGVNDKMHLTDIWWDIHRIKHKRDRDAHPCQLPDALMERIIRLATNEGDVVLDAFGGAGTTPIVAAKLKRHYVAMELDEAYVKITRQKLAEIEQKGFVERRTVSQPTRKYTKKELQLELRQLAAELGRLPEPEDVNQMSQYDIGVFLDTFSTWGKALKAAKIERITQ